MFFTPANFLFLVNTKNSIIAREHTTAITNFKLNLTYGDWSIVTYLYDWFIM